MRKRTDSVNLSLMQFFTLLQKILLFKYIDSYRIIYDYLLMLRTERSVEVGKRLTGKG